ncbi:hypothetical protein M407DRAFT_225517 [Tulasnella calospora MUT 4182]|uniref:Uncharacterized protein n=1 Tax=Tulasnella calospora MUT 4182 TaxID=1051891 RepID=A0A0C3LAK5_9AGAM|nr:hypothetical protein M407DRAFT_225517 [Tulasnella calospora MUT 4182]
MHYEASGHMDVSPEAIYKRDVVDKAGGSYSFGQQTLMLGMLRAMGYRAYACPARANTASEATDPIHFEPFSHVVLLVQIPTDHRAGRDSGNETYLVDVGFGLGIVRPMQVVDGEEMPSLISPERHRLVKTHRLDPVLDETDGATAPFAEEWHLQVNAALDYSKLPEGTWRTLYQFTFQQCDLREIEIMSRMVENDPKSYFWNNLVGIIYNKGAPIGQDGPLIGVSEMVGSKVTTWKEGRSPVLRTLDDVKPRRTE